MSGAFWAYDGWINITYVSGEIKEPQRNIPRAMFIGTAVVMAVYVLTNLAYLYVIPVPQMVAQYDAQGSSYLVATDVASRFFTGSGGAAIAIAILISTFGATNGTLLASARVYFAMARERFFFRKIGEVHPKYRTPGPSLIIQGAWASLLVLSGTFDQLTDMLIFVSWIFYAAAAYGVFVLRKKMPDVERPYKVWGYPIVPALFVVFATIYVVFTVYSDISVYLEMRAQGQPALINSLMGLLLVAIGIPGYLYWSAKRKREGIVEG
jgi:APA family basic amino acid/polyamine antiporter